MMMWGCPDAALIASTLRDAQGAGFNYDAGSATIDQPPAGYFRNHTDAARLAGWLALPYVSQLQRRFGRESAHVMQSLT